MLSCHFERSREAASHETLKQVQSDVNSADLISIICTNFCKFKP